MKHSAAVASVFLIALAVVGAAAAQDRGKARAEAVPVNGEYRIGVDDVLDIAVWNNTAISRTVPVRPDGMISLPLLNEVQAAGLTPPQLRESLMAKLVDYMPAPEVSVIVREVHSFKVSVMGEVRKAGRYDLNSRATIMDALAQAGGFTEFANRSRVVIMRTEGAAVKRIPFNYNRAVSQQSENLLLQPGDIVVVP